MKVCNVDMSPTLVSLLRFVSIPSISQGSCRVCAVFVVLCFWGNSHTLYCVPTFSGNLSTQTLSLSCAWKEKSKIRNKNLFLDVIGKLPNKRNSVSSSSSMNATATGRDAGNRRWPSMLHHGYILRLCTSASAGVSWEHCTIIKYIVDGI